MISCRKCRWAAIRVPLNVVDLAETYKALPTWNHFHRERGKWVFFDSRKRKRRQE